MTTAADEVVAAASAAPPRLGHVRVVVVDGPAGSGKSTFADALAVAGADAVLHLDDLYEGWSGLEGSLWPRLTAQVLEPLRRGRPGRYQRYDWGAEGFAEWVDVPVPTMLVVEGCGSARRAADAFASVRVWVEAPPGLRLERGIARDGEHLRPQWERWMTDEAEHFRVERTRERADVRLDATGRVTGWSARGLRGEAG